MKNIPKKYHSAVRKLIKKAREDEQTKNWYFENDELVITKGKWIIDRYKKHQFKKEL